MLNRQCLFCTKTLHWIFSVKFNVPISIPLKLKYPKKSFGRCLNFLSPSLDNSTNTHQLNSKIQLSLLTLRFLSNSCTFPFDLTTHALLGESFVKDSEMRLKQPRIRDCNHISPSLTSWIISSGRAKFFSILGNGRISDSCLGRKEGSLWVTGKGFNLNFDMQSQILFYVQLGAKQFLTRHLRC